MSPVLGLWICAFFTLTRAGLVNVTVAPDDPRIVYSDGWQTGGCGMEACGMHESISFRFTGIALYYIGGPSSSSPAPSINVTLDRNVTQVDLSAGHPDKSCNSISFTSQHLDNEQHGVNATLAGPTKAGSALTDCIFFNGFIYTAFDNTTHPSGLPVVTPTPSPDGRDGLVLPIILGIAIGVFALSVLIVALFVHSRLKSKSPLLPATLAPLHMLDRSMNWKLGRKGHKKRNSTFDTKAGPAQDFAPPPEHDRNWQELR